MPEPKTLSHGESSQTSCKTRLASNTDLLLATLSKDIESVRDCHERISGASTTGWRSLSSLYQDCILDISPTLNFLMGGCIVFLWNQLLMIIAPISRYILRSYTAFLCLILNTWSGSIVVNASSSDTLGAISSESKLCSEIGLELLKRGVSLFILDSNQRSDHMTSGKCGRCPCWNTAVCWSCWWV